MFKIEETGPEIQGNKVQFRIYLPSILKSKGFSVKVFVIDRKKQFDPGVRADEYDMEQELVNPLGDNLWGDVDKCRWCSDFIEFNQGIYIYRFEITGPKKNSSEKVRSIYFGDPCARETDVGVFSVIRIPEEKPFQWEDKDFKLPNPDDILLYEINVDEFANDFRGVADRIPYLKSLGINVIELLPVNSVEDPCEWGYMPVFYFSPEERYGGPAGLKYLVNECHKNKIGVVLDVVYAHACRMFTYQIAYDRFFDLWYDDSYSDLNGLHRSPNPMVSAYNNFGQKHDWQMKSVQEFFCAVNTFWLDQYHVDGFRYDHVNGFKDKKPIERDGKINWYNQENRPTFKSLQLLTKNTYQESKKYNRFVQPNGSSSIIQIAEDLGESAYQLSQVSNSTVTGCWEDKVANLSKNMARYNFLSTDFGKELLLSDERFDKQGDIGTKNIDNNMIAAQVVQYYQTHDTCSLFYLMQNGFPSQSKLSNGDIIYDAGLEYRNGLDGQPWYKLQPYAIALLTCVGIPMLWQGQEFAENTGLAEGDNVRVKARRPIHFDYFYNPESDSNNKSPVLPLVTLYRNLGNIRHSHPALRSHRNNAKVEYCNTNDKVLVYRRWCNNEIIIVALNFSDHEIHVPIPFGHSGTWEDILHGSYKENMASPWSIQVTDSLGQIYVNLPGNFGRILRYKQA